MRGVNKVFVLGNLGNDPDVKYTQAGMAIVSMSVATTSFRKVDGQQTEKTEWHRIKAFGKLGELCAEYLHKGQAVFVEGRIEYGSYEKDGVKHYTTDVVAEDVQFLGGGEGGGHASSGRASAPRSGGGRGTSERAPAPREAAQREVAGMRSDPGDGRHPPANPTYGGGEFVDDDIPF